MDEQRVLNILDDVIAAAIYTALTALPVVAYKYVKSMTEHYPLVLLATIVTAGAAAALIYYCIKRQLWGCRKTRRSIGKLRNCLHTLPPGLRPAVASMSTETAQNLCFNKDGENITLTQYMKLISDVADYRKVVDVTYIAVTPPSEWGRRSDLDLYRGKTDKQSVERFHLLNHLWNKYFDNQKSRKQAPPVIRMRRLMLFNGDCPKEEQESLDYLREEHKSAHIGLIKISKLDLPHRFQRDLVLILCDNKRKWIVESDYEPSKATINTTLISEVESSAEVRALFRIINGIYTPAGVADGRLLVADGDNAPDDRILRKCGIVL